MVAASRGDPRAQAELHDMVRAFSRALCSRLSSESLPDLDWEDVAQDSSRRLFGAAMSRFHGKSEKNYVYTIVKSSMIQMLRSARRRRQREKATRVSECVDEKSSVRLEVVSILSRLEDRCSELLRRTFLYGMPYGDLAREMGLAESSVRAQVSRCLRRARELGAA